LVKTSSVERVFCWAISPTAPGKYFGDENENENLITNTYAIILEITPFEA